MGALPSVDDVTYVAAMAEALMYWDGGGLPTGWRGLVNGRVPSGTYSERVLAGVGFASSRQRTFRLLCRRALKQRANLPVGPAIFGRRGL